MTTDRRALLALYGLTGGATWNNNDNWDTDVELSLWHGVGVDAQGRVVTLKLPYNNLQGTTTRRDIPAFCTQSSPGLRFYIVTPVSVCFMVYTSKLLY